MDLRIDTTDVQHEAAKWRAAPAILADEERQAMQRSVLAVQGQAMKEAPVKTGHLRRSIAGEVRPAGGTVVGVVGTNVPYARYVHEGRGPIEAAPGHVLRFTIGGKVLFRKRVGPAKANPFLRRALAQMRPKIVAEFRAIGPRLAKRLAG